MWRRQHRSSPLRNAPIHEADVFRSLRNAPIHEADVFRSLRNAPICETDVFRSLRNALMHETDVFRSLRIAPIQLRPSSRASESGRGEPPPHLLGRDTASRGAPGPRHRRRTVQTWCRLASNSCERHLVAHRRIPTTLLVGAIVVLVTLTRRLAAVLFNRLGVARHGYAELDLLEQRILTGLSRPMKR